MTSLILSLYDTYKQFPLRHCERSEAIQKNIAKKHWIASSQKTLLAMTGTAMTRTAMTDLNLSFDT